MTDAQKRILEALTTRKDMWFSGTEVSHFVPDLSVPYVYTTLRHLYVYGKVQVKPKKSGYLYRAT